MFRYQKKKTTFGIQFSPKRSIRLKFNRQHGPSFFAIEFMAQVGDIMINPNTH